MSAHSDGGNSVPPDPIPPNSRNRLLRPGTISEALRDPAERERLELPADEAGRVPVLVELNLRHSGTLGAAARRLLRIYTRAVLEPALEGGRDRPAPVPVGANYYRLWLTPDEVAVLVKADQARLSDPADRAIYRIWPDFPVYPLIDRSVATVKGDAALRSFQASGLGITWAVVDSGVDAAHPHFAQYDNLGGTVVKLHRDFTGGEHPLSDATGHGTHVAGIIAGGLPAHPGGKVMVGQHVIDEDNQEQVIVRVVDDPARLTGVAPQTKLVSLKVIGDDGASSSSAVIAALHYVRTELNGDGKLPRVHGVNLSLGYKFDAEWFAAGQSPLCVEVDRLVRSGVVVVVAAGNNGYGQVTTDTWGTTRLGLTLTITDPGNAAEAITVGATHRDSPHTYGVSYFSSKGPTGDGRLKPDLVAPGERVTSCAAGEKRDELAGLWGGQPPPDAAAYVDDTGTSMAAPHVSGAIAGFLSIRNEFIGRPETVKRLFCENATSLGRERYFEGHGLVDLMRTIQAV